jgi:hypothetical protein
VQRAPIGTLPKLKKVVLYEDNTGSVPEIALKLARSECQGVRGEVFQVVGVAIRLTIRHSGAIITPDTIFKEQNVVLRTFSKKYIGIKSYNYIFSNY